MADDVTFQSGTPATPPATTVIATDEEGGKHYQWVKLVFGADATITKVSAANPLPVTLATGAATAANQTTIIGHVDGIEALLATLAGAVGGTEFQVDVLTLPNVTIGAAIPAGNNNIGDVDVASSALPTGAATAANQATGNASLATLAGAVAGTEVQVDVLTIPSVTVGAALPAGNNNIGDVDVASLPALAAGTNNIGDVDVLTVPAPLSTAGNGTAAAAHRVTIASDSTGQVAITGSLPAGNNNIGDVDVLSLPALPAGNNNIGDVDVATLPNVTLAAGTNTNEVVGDVAEDAALAGNPVRIGGRASVARPTAMSADNDIVSPWLDRYGAQHVVPGACTTATLANVASSATSVTLAASNTSRKGLIIHNDSTQVLYLKFGATASATSYTYKLAAGDHWEMPGPIYTGVVDGIWASANGNARTTELT